jgi:hypothetical protein
MVLAPEPYLSACLEVLHHACLQARLIGHSGEQAGLPAQHSAELADLMDAVHDLPDLLLHWEEFDERRLRAFLAEFNRSWSPDQTIDLLAAYDDALARARVAHAWPRSA